MGPHDWSYAEQSSSNARLSDRSHTFRSRVAAATNTIKNHNQIITARFNQNHTSPLNRTSTHSVLHRWRWLQSPIDSISIQLRVDSKTQGDRRVGGGGEGRHNITKRGTDKTLITRRKTNQTDINMTQFFTGNAGAGMKSHQNIQHHPIGFQLNGMTHTMITVSCGIYPIHATLERNIKATSTANTRKLTQIKNKERILRVSEWESATFRLLSATSVIYLRSLRNRDRASPPPPFSFPSPCHLLGNNVAIFSTQRRVSDCFSIYGSHNWSH